MEKPMIEIVGLKKYFETRDSGIFGKKREIRAVDDVDFQINKGEIIGLIGESGSGKTTLARVILGLTKANGGHVYIDGEDITSMSKHRLKAARSKIAVVFQDPVSNLNPRDTVENSIIRPMIIHGISKKEAKERARDVLKKVKLDEQYLNSYPHQLSGGQLQRIAIARALAMKPKLMILDEPTSALDISVQAQILNLLLDLQKEENLTYLMITHDLNSIRYVSDKVLVMYLGNLVEFGTSDEVFNSAQHPYTKGLMASAPAMDPLHRNNKGKTMRGEPGSLINIGNGCRFCDRCQYVTSDCESQKPKMRHMSDTHVCACFQNQI